MEKQILKFQVAVTYPSNSQNLLAENLGLTVEQTNQLCEILAQGKPHKFVQMTASGEDNTALIELTLQFD